MEDTQSTDYPALCTITATEREDLRELYTSLDNRCGVDEWPPRDDLGNVYPLWFTIDDVDDNGLLRDRNGNTYNPFQGNLEPQWEPRGRCCNAPLRKWKIRYPDIRYCGIYVDRETGYDHHCKTHQFNESMKSAEEYVQTGAFTQTVDHLYDHLSPWKKLMAWGTYENLMGESAYDFAPEDEYHVLDFSDEPLAPDDVDEDRQLEVTFSYPTDHLVPAQALFVASMQQITMMEVQQRVLWEGTRADGTEEGVMESQTVEKAQLTAPPSEHDSSPQQFKTIEAWSEHHLNLPLSRLIKDQPRLLEMGGVSTDPSENSDEIDADNVVLEIEADVDGAETVNAGTDPTAVGDDMMSQSAKIKQSVESSAERDDDATQRRDTDEDSNT